ncbi:hypothetical protein ACRAWD_04165 [Caulobacter segnis]
MYPPGLVGPDPGPPALRQGGHGPRTTRPRAGRGDDVDQLAEDWADRLPAVTRRAEDLVGLED